MSNYFVIILGKIFELDILIPSHTSGRRRPTPTLPHPTAFPFLLADLSEQIFRKFIFMSSKERAKPNKQLMVQSLYKKRVHQTKKIFEKSP